MYTAPIAPGPIPGVARALGQDEIDGLWDIFVTINETWRLFHTRDADHPVPDASNLRSTWLELVRLRAEPPDYTEHSNISDCIDTYPTYVGEYINALAVAQALQDEPHDKDREGGALHKLLFCSPGYANTRLGHAKRYVVDEFMSVMIVAGGFKEFGPRNYNGFVAGSRFDRATEICVPVTFPARPPEKEGEV